MLAGSQGRRDAGQYARMTPQLSSAVHPIREQPILRHSGDGPAARHRRHGTGRRTIPGAPLIQAVESVLPTVVLALVIIAENLHVMSDGFNSFLSLRVTVKNVLLCVLFIGACASILRAWGVYDARSVRHRSNELVRIVSASSVCTMLAMVFPLTSVNGGVRWEYLAYLWYGLVGSEIAIRGVRRVVARRGRAREPRRVIIAGTGPRALAMWNDFTADHAASYELVGFVDVHRTAWMPRSVDGRHVGTLEDLERMLMKQAIDEVFIALPIKSRYQEFQHVISLCERFGVRARYRADMFTTWVAWPRAEHGHSVSMNVVPDDHRLVLKRLVDIVGALAALVVLSPVIVCTALAIKLTSRGPVLFAQERLGLNKRQFLVYKFRSMVVGAAALQDTLEEHNEADGPVFKIANDPRVTSVGRFIRRTSIDELPQLLNVLKGEMSLVGPRPLALRDVARIRRGTDMRRFSVKPGITGLWQVSGRSQLAYGDWIRLDLKYIDSWSLLGDLRILLLTIPAVLRGTGAM